MRSNMVNKKHFLLPFVLSLIAHGETRDESPVNSRNLITSAFRGGGDTTLRKLVVDIETDFISAISPLTISGTRYPWRIFSPELAQSQQNILESDNFIRREYYMQEPVLSSNAGNTRFLLYQDRRSYNRSIVIDFNTEATTQGILPVDPTNQVKILIHGFQSGPTLSFGQETKDAYLRETNHTVIVVDWEELAFPKIKATRLLYYPAITANAFSVGERVATLIDYLLENGVISDLSQIHIIGHSLGAHAAGYAGDLIQSKYGRKIGRITALDAALLAFIGPNKKRRLDKGDAEFVDAIHTSGIGVYDPIAHADFYPNGGRNQASCYIPETYRANLAGSDLTRALEGILQSCSHARSYYFFIKSIQQDDIMWGCKCLSWRDYRTFCKESCAHRERFGEYVSPTARGKFFLEIEL